MEVAITGFLMEAEVTAKVGAQPHQRSAERTTRREGRSERRSDTRPGTLSLICRSSRKRLHAELHRTSQAGRQGADQRDPNAVVEGVCTRKIEALSRQLEISCVSAGQASGCARRWTKRCGQFL